MLGDLFVVFKAQISKFVGNIKQMLGVTQGAAQKINASAKEMEGALTSAFSGQVRNNITNLSENISVTRENIVQLKEQLKILLSEQKKQKEGTEEFKKTARAISSVRKSLFETQQDLAKYNILARDQKKALADSRLAAEDNSSAMEATSRAVNAASQALLLFNSTSDTTKGVAKALSIAMGAISAVIAIQNLRLRENSILINTLARAQAIYTSATTGANAATVAFKTTLLSLGVGAVVLGLGYLATKIGEVGRAAEEAQNQIKRIANRFKETEKNIQDQIDLIDKQVVVDQKRAKIAGKTEDDLLKIRQDGYNKQIAILRQLEKEIPKLGEKTYKTLIKQGAAQSVAYEERRLFEKEITEKVNKQILEIQNNSLNAELDLKVANFNKDKKLTEKKSKEEIKEIKKTAKAQEQIALNETRINTARLANVTTDAVEKQKIVNNGELELLNIREKYLLQVATAEGVSADEIRAQLTQLAIDRINIENDNAAKLKSAIDKRLDEQEKAAITEGLIEKESQEGLIKKREEFYRVLRAGAANEYRNNQKNEEQYKTALLELDLAFAKDKLKIYKKGSQEYLEAVKEVADAEIALNNSKNKTLTDDEKQFAKNITRIFTREFQQLANTLVDALSGALTRAFEGTSEQAQVNIEILKAQQRELSETMKEAGQTELQMLQNRRQYLENEAKLAEATQSELSKVFNSILGGVADFLQNLGVGLIAAAIATEAFKESLLKAPKVAIAAGAAAIVAAAGVRAVIAKGPKFANGGIVSGPTLGLVGEYPGASTNPEVIAPLDKLQKMIGGNGSQEGGFIAETRISGRDLAIVLNRYNKDLQRG
jgi:hypothetical protein